MDRRKMLSWMIGAGTLTSVGIVGIPALITAVSPVAITGEEEAWREVGRLEEFAVGTVKEATVPILHERWAEEPKAQGVYVWRPDAERVVVFSRACTDLSCPVHYDPGSGWYYCPCHGGIFDREGEPVAGPPKYPLYRFAHRIREGILEIDLSSVPVMV